MRKKFNNVQAFYWNYMIVNDLIIITVERQSSLYNGILFLKRNILLPHSRLEMFLFQFPSFFSILNNVHLPKFFSKYFYHSYIYMLPVTAPRNSEICMWRRVSAKLQIHAWVYRASAYMYVCIWICRYFCAVYLRECIYTYAYVHVYVCT